MNLLKTLHENHQGKVSDKWALYLESYDAVLSPYRSQTVNMLEIGVQNGGSLEVWAQYFPNAQHIIGCDINPKCGELKYSDDRIQIIIGNAVDEQTQQKILQTSPRFDIIIDDGSHTSGDIVRTFARYFDRLKDGGVFIFEDLHCSYWQDYEGGLHHPRSSISFFKSLVDIVNHEHWGLPLRRNELLESFYQTYHCPPALDLSHIHSVQFLNSVCIITKRQPVENELGERIVRGSDAIVETQPLSADGSTSAAPDQTDNPHSVSWQARSEQQNQSLQTLLEKIFQQNETSAQKAEQLQQQIEDLAQKFDRQQQLSGQIEQYQRQIKGLQTELADISDERNALQHKFDHAVQNLDETAQNLISLNSSRSDLEHRLHQEMQHLAKHKGLWTVKLIKPLIQTEKAVSSANRYRKGFRLLVREKGSIGKAYQHLRKAYKQTKSFKTVKQLLKNAALHGPLTAPPPSPMPEILSRPVHHDARRTCALKVAIIAEMSIPQCKKYRVIQKQEMFEAQRIPCSVTSWTDYDEARKQISLASVVIFYRVPGFESVMALIEECRRLKIKTFWDVDDLIFDEHILKTSSTINSLNKEERDGVINGARLYRQAMLSCDEGIASTSGLAKAMQDAGLKTVHIVENALDVETLAAAQQIHSRRHVSDGLIRIIYGSGTKTHNIDFMEAAPALAETLKKHPNVRFRYIGFLELPDYFDAVKNQIEHIPFCSYTEYLGHLAECDISIAPLENFIFNDAKSNIKYLEASITRLASVCSPRAAFSDVIEHGHTGLLADNTTQWLEAFESLIHDRTLREKMAEAAYENVLNRYSPQTVGRHLAEFIGANDSPGEKQTKIMAFNVYYHPQSFGGATIVAEQINKLLAEDPSFSVSVVTTLPVSHYLPAYSVIRYEYRGITVFGVAVPPEDSALYDNPRFKTITEKILELVKPDIAHIHCIQGMGIGIVEACREKGIKTIATMHDAWWICPNQFMLDKHNRFQEHWHPEDFPESYRPVGSALAKIDMVAAPSVYFARLHEQQTGRKIYVNKNGVMRPAVETDKHPSHKIRFGYVGGMTEIKGVHLILEAFRKNRFQNTELIIVDNMLNMGSQSFFDRHFQGIENYRLVPAYNQDNIDQFFNGIDVLLFPTQWKESFGLTVREAILRNVWVIATDAGGVSEDIIEGENGTIIPFDSGSEELSAAIRDVCARYQNMKNGTPVNLPKSHIRTFEEQKEELVGMYRKLLSEA